MPAQAATFQRTLISDSLTFRDTYLKDDVPFETRGSDKTFLVQASTIGRTWNAIVSFALPPLGGFTVTSARLQLHQSGAVSSDPIVTRVRPLAESWSETSASWYSRQFFQFWQQQGGSVAASWVDRRLLSSATTGSIADWQIGPIVSAWQNGELANNGLVLGPDAESGDYDVTFDSREATPSANRPQLVLRYTNSPPAIHKGTAEIQPPAVKSNQPNTRFVLWLDVDAGTTTPSGTPTGFDRVIVSHVSGFQVIALDSVRANGTKLSALGTSFSDAASQVTFVLPKLTNTQKVAVYFRANVASAVLTDGTDLVTSLDDASTSGAEAQTLWPGNADGTAANGDSWTLAVVAGAPTSIRFVPDTLSVSPGQCTTLNLFGIDSGGNRFSIVADSIRVIPSALGTATTAGSFCALGLGTAKVVATYGSQLLRDTATVSIVAGAKPVVEQLTLRNRVGSPSSVFAPEDTLLCDVAVRDGDGFQDVKRVDLDLSFAGHASDAGAPAYRARLRWQRGGAPAFTLVDPSGSSWRALPALSVVDTLTNATTAQTVRFAFAAGRIARAGSGQWSIAALATDATPSDTGSRVLNGLTALPRLVVTAVDAGGAFSSGPPGAAGLPLTQPASSRVTLQLVANADALIQAAVGPLAGQTFPGDTLFTTANRQAVAWGETATLTSTWLDSAWTTVHAAIQAPTIETPASNGLYLWINHPAGARAQNYVGPLRWRATGPSGTVSNTVTIPLSATVSTAPRAASAATAEVRPTQAMAGTVGSIFHVWLRPEISVSETGVDRVFVSLPSGYGVPRVTSVSVGGVPASFADSSRADLIDVLLPTHVTTTASLDLGVSLDAPTIADAFGSAWIVRFDDRATPEAAQTASEGDADGLANENRWVVSVGPGAPAAVEITPSQATVRVDSSLSFVAHVTDAWNNIVPPAPLWSLQGALGSIGSSSGVFTATNPGTGTVTAQQGSATAIASLTTLPSRGIDTRLVSGPASLYQGQRGATLTLDVENPGSGSCSLDTLRLMFSRASSADANGDFSVTPAFTLPARLAAGARARFSFSVDVSEGALAAPLAVGARASGIDSVTSVRLSDAIVDSSLAVSVRSGGIQVSVSAIGSTLRPGTSGAPFVALALRNFYPEPRTLRSMRLHDTSQGPGTRAQLDSELGELALFADDGDARLSPSADTLLQRTTVRDTMASFSALAFSIPGGATRTLFLTSDVPLGVRDGDLANLAILGSTNLGWVESNTTVAATWPVTSTVALPFDGMTSGQIQLRDVPAVPLAPGSRRNLALDVILPANGYEADILQRLGVEHLGDAVAGTDLLAVEAWRDDGNGLFDAVLDRTLGSLRFTGSRWELTGLSESVPLQGLRVFFTVDLSAGAIEGRSLKLGLPSGDDHAVGMRSGNSGPLDARVLNANSLTISGADRVAFGLSPDDSSAVEPGKRGVPLMHLIATNRYALQRTLTGLDLENTTTGPGSIAQRDGEFGFLRLRLDGNGNGRLDDTSLDPAVGAMTFAAGRASFKGLSVPLPPGVGVHLFVTADVSAGGARDGDRLSVRVPDATSVTLDTAAVVVGAWPIGVAPRSVDGFPVASLVSFTTPTVSVGPGEGPVLAFDVALPGNGYQADTMRRLTLVNRGSALPSDLAQVGLWRDGGDGAFDAGAGDDRWVTSMAGSDSLWFTPILSEPLSAGANRCFVSVTIAATAGDDRTLQFTLPVLGVENVSDNDGPTDASVPGPGELTITSSPLVTTVWVTPASVLGGTIDFRLTVRNAGTNALAAIVPAAVAVSGTGAISLLAGPTPATVTLAPTQVDSFTWRFRADAVGDVRLSSWVQGTEVGSDLPRRSPTLTSPAHRIYAEATSLDLYPTQTMPVSVNVGQTDIVPLALSFTNPGGTNGSDARISRLVLRLEDENGVGVVPSQLLSRVELREGSNVYLTRTALETSGALIDLPLSSPVTVSSSEPTTVGVYLDLLPSTSVPSFRVSLVDANRIVAEDATSGAPVMTALTGGSFPVVSAAAHVVASATRVDLRTSAAVDRRATRGQTDVPVLRCDLTNPGVPGVASDVRVATLSAVMVDATGLTLAQPGRLLRRIVVRSGTRLHLDLAVPPGQDSTLRLPLALPLTLSASLATPFEVAVTVADSAVSGRYRLRLAGSTEFEARDVNTRALVPVIYATDPVEGDTLTVQLPARALEVAGTARMPASLVVGEPNVIALSALLRHPDGAGTASIRLDSLDVDLRDQARRPVSPDALLSRLAVNWNGVQRGQVLAMPLTGGRVSVPLAGAVLTAGDSARLDVIIDLDPAAPSGTLELAVPASGFLALEANTGAPIAITPPPGSELPVLSGLGRFQAPGRDLTVGLESRVPAGLTSDPVAVPVAVLPLSNASPAGNGGIQVEAIVLRAADKDRLSIALGDIAARLEAWIGDVKWAQSAPLTPDSLTATLAGASRIAVETGTPVEMEIRMIPRPGATRSGFRIGLDRPDVRVVQSSNSQLAVIVRPQDGSTFPMWTETSAFTPASLGGSYSNFPNPFAAGRQATTFAFYLPRSGQVTLRVLNPLGEGVATLLDGVACGPGLRQQDRWDGRNGRGETVYNGVYVAELAVRYDDGTRERVLRKVAVVR